MALRRLGVAVVLATCSVAFGEALTIRVHAFKQLAVVGATRVDAVDPTVVKAVVSTQDQVLLEALKLGSTTLRVWESAEVPITFAIEVIPDEREPTIRAIRELLGDAEGLVFRATNESLYLDGSIDTLADEERVELIWSRFPEVQIFARSSLTRPVLSTSVHNALARAGIRTVEAQCSRAQCTLTGSADAGADLERAQAILDKILKKWRPWY